MHLVKISTENEEALSLCSLNDINLYLLYCSFGAASPYIRVDGATFGKVRASGRLPGPSGGAPMAGAVSARPGAVSKAPKGAIGG
jgi:hypothetical protein